MFRQLGGANLTGGFSGLEAPYHLRRARQPYPEVGSGILKLHMKTLLQGSLGGAAVWRLPLARGAILETWDRIPRQAPGMEPASVSASLSLCSS